MMGMGLDTAEVCAAARITPRQLNHWVRRGYVTPQDPERSGSGRPFSFSPVEVGVAVRIGMLVAQGYRVAAAAQVARDDWSW
jgi:hypothetical protein